MSLLELAMRESVELAQNSGVLKGPWQILEGYLVEDIIRMDLELRNFNPAATRRDAEWHFNRIPVYMYILYHL